MTDVSEAPILPVDAEACRVLIAEDDPRVREGLRELLVQDGFTVVGAAADGNEAVTMAEALAPDVIVMDFRMPEMDGIEASLEVKRRLPYAEIILLSAYDDRKLQAEAAAAGVFRFLVKGCAPMLITRAVSEASSRSEASSPRQEIDPGHP